MNTLYLEGLWVKFFNERVGRVRIEDDGLGREEDASPNHTTTLRFSNLHGICQIINKLIISTASQEDPTVYRNK